MATIHCLRRRWTAKQYISATMLGSLVATAIVATISISLAPARISFSIPAANIVLIPQKNDSSQIINTHLNFSLVANNTSPRTAVKYGATSVEIWYGPAAIAWVRTDAAVPEPDRWKQPGSVVNFNVSADYGYNQTSNATDDCRVVVESKVWFKYGLASTRPFTIRFSCWPVDFVYNKGFPVKCG